MARREEMVELYAAVARASREGSEDKDEMPPANNHENESFRQILEQIANTTKATLEQLPALRAMVAEHEGILRGVGRGTGLIGDVDTLQSKVEKLEEDNERELEALKSDKRTIVMEFVKLCLAAAIGAIGSWIGHLALKPQ